jgi:hypothetical protein
VEENILGTRSTASWSLNFGSNGLEKKRCGPGLLQRLCGFLILKRTFRQLYAGHCASMGSLRTDNLDVRHPIRAEVILNVFDKRLLVPSQPLGIVA